MGCNYPAYASDIVNVACTFAPFFAIWAKINSCPGGSGGLRIY